MQLTLGEARAHSGEQGEIRREAERGELPPAGAERKGAGDRRDEQQRGKGGECASPSGGAGGEGVGGGHAGLLVKLSLTLLAKSS